MEVKSTLIIEFSTLSVWTALKFKINRIDIEYICQLSGMVCTLGMKMKVRLKECSERLFGYTGLLLTIRSIVCNNIIT